jgi:HNH endonuclease
MKIVHHCLECGKEFTSWKLDSKFCCRDCKCKGLCVKINAQEVIALYESGMTQEEVAKVLQVTKAAIARTLARAGYKCRKAIKRDQFGEKNHQWKGGTKVDDGYILAKCRNHPRANKRGYVYQHILIMEKHLGRYLNYSSPGSPDNEVVHHINHDRLDNRIENLQVMSQREHSILHNKERRKKVLCVETGKIYSSAREASLSVGKNPNSVADAICKGHKTKGFTWKYV